ncbi:MAG TPA: alpha/beta hydrolase [Blastocatellia bacterium]|nr:alpha/beta hydrolase [Blastocatellia bacterium]
MARRQAAGERPYNTMSVAEAREMATRLSRLSSPGETVASVSDRLIPGPVEQIPIRIYKPDAEGALPLFVFFHGGGWVVGNLETGDTLCRAITNAAKCAVVSVNYRHAPEHKFPAAVDDAYAALCWCAENAVELGGTADQLSVGGFSAGGNLATVVSLIARDKGGPKIKTQVLIAPITNHSFDTNSYHECGEGYGLTSGMMKWFWNHYLNSPEEGSHPYASPSQAKDLSGLPPALVINAEFDPLRDEGQAYAQQLKASGVEVETKFYEGMIHMFMGPQAVRDIAKWINR